MSLYSIHYFISDFQLIIHKIMYVIDLYQEGWTPAHWAVSGGHTKILKVLWEIGVDMNAKNDVYLSIFNDDFFTSDSQMSIRRVMYVIVL